MPRSVSIVSSTGNFSTFLRSKKVGLLGLMRRVMRTESRCCVWVRSILPLSIILLLCVAIQAQINGPRPSVTSLGGQFTIFNPPGPRASVTSLGPNGWGPGPCCRPGSPNPGFTFHHHHHRGDGNNNGAYYGGYPIVAMPYYVGGA